MSFHIKIEGLKELEKQLQELMEEISLSSIDYWCKKIEAEARRICPQERGESVVLKAVPADSGKFNIRFRCSKEASLHERIYQNKSELDAIDYKSHV